MYKKSLDLLKAHSVEFENRLTINEIVQIEKVYDIVFPESLRDFLMTALPISEGFYNWRNMEYRNVDYIKRIIKYSLQGTTCKPWKRAADNKTALWLWRGA